MSETAGSPPGACPWFGSRRIYQTFLR